MNIEEKAKAYDEALDRCKEWASGILGHSADDSPKDIAKFIFPHLAESEDERIRKALIWHLKADTDFVSNGVTKTECIAWLEKQKEPENTSASTMIPSCWEVEQKESLRDFIDNFPYSDEQKEQKLYWKPTNTDVALLNKAIITNNTLTSTEREQLDIIRSRFGYCRASNCSGIMQKEQKHPNGCFTCDEYKKGYEEGRRNGFTAGYNKAMKEVEQKEQKTVVTHGETYRVDTLGTQQVIAGKMPQKPAEWSEEDEGELQNAIDALEFLGKKGVYKSESGYDAALQAASWLKNLSLDLKKRNEDVTKLCSNEWSEEDKQKLNRIYEILGYAADDRGFLTSKRIIGDKEAIELQDFLSSLRLQPKQE